MNSNSKLLLTVFIGSLIAFVALSGIAVKRMHLLSDTALTIQKKTLMDDYDLMIKGQVQTAVSLLVTLESRAANGEITQIEAKKLGADQVRQLRYQKEGYFWIDTIDGTNIVLLGKPAEGKNRIDLQDNHGKYFIREIIAQGRKDGGGYTDYWFPKAGSNDSLPKRGYSLEFKPWGWVVGTGNYIDDINTIMAEQHKIAQQKHATIIGFFTLFSIVLVLTLLGVGFKVYSILRSDKIALGLAEENLRTSEEHFRKIFDESPDAYSLLSDGVFTECNRATELLFRCDRQQFCGKSPAHFTPEHQPDGRLSAEAAEEKISETFRSGTNTFEWLHRREDGTEFWVEVVLSAMNKQGRQILFSSMRDITERKQTHNKLRKLLLAVEQSPVTTVITDLDGSIEFVNPVFTELTGYTAEEAIGLNPRVLKSGLMPPETFVELWATITAGKTWEGELLNKKKNGELFWERAVISALYDDSGAITNYVAVKEDITERKQIMEELGTAREKAESATQAKSSFLATMSHEIRTPMNGVIGMTGLLLDTELTAEQRDYAETVRKSGENLLTLINEILDFSKIEAGKLELEIINFNLRTTIDDAVDLLSNRASEKNLELICRIDPAVPSYLKGDPGRIRQIVINLAGNAIKFTHQGEVVISASLTSEQDGFAHILFEVHDTGIGIAKERIGALFNPFTQVDGSTTRKYGGTGLGLAICKQLVELMGGEKGITSEEGKGSTFWFSSRFEKQPIQISDVSRASEELKQTDISGTHVLVVDDNATNRLLMTTLLKHWNCRYEAVVDAESGLELLLAAAHSGDPFKLALLDQEMPSMDGLELGRRIKADPLLESTLLVMVTSMGQRGDATLLDQIGFAGYLAKPLRQAQLFDCIAMVLGRSNKTLEVPKRIITKYTVAEYAERSTRILLAEDNIINQKVAQSMLNKLGYKADVVANGQEAVKALEMIRYDLVLMDCQMPEMDGFEATTVIRNPDSKVLNHKVPIIAMTANAMQEDRDHCLASGMDDYLSKPVKKESLAEMIQKWS